MEPRNNTMNKRTANFTHNEENVLIKLVKKYADIIDNKKTDSSNNHKKAAAWVQIENEFNSTVGETYRSATILRTKYLNMKRIGRRRTNSTGGGRPMVLRDDENDTSNNEIIAAPMTSFNSEFDITDKEEFDITENELTTELSDWTTPKQDCTDVKEQCILDEYQQKLRHNEEIHQQNLIHIQEEHDNKLRMAQEEHELKISILKLQRQKLLNELSQ